MDRIQKKLEERQTENSLRKLKISSGIDFCSNDYLGIATNQLIKVRASLNHGSKGSRLLAGNYPLVEEAEKIIADFHNAPAGLIYNSGYDANIGLLSCVADKGDTIIYDQLSHASIRDGIRLSLATSFSFLHNDILDLEKKLKNAKGSIFIITESVFSMDGDMAPLKQIKLLSEKYNAKLIVDEAHATGIIGPKGAGLVQALDMETSCFARIHTFGKALGAQGAIILCSVELKNFLINFSRSFIYTTALPEVAIAAILAAYSYFPVMDDERKNLEHLIKKIQNTDLNLIKSQTPIQAFVMNGNDAVKQMAQKLQAANFDVRPILYPTVPRGTERLRIILHAFNTNEQLENLIELLNE